MDSGCLEDANFVTAPILKCVGPGTLEETEEVVDSKVQIPETVETILFFWCNFSEMRNSYCSLCEVSRGIGVLDQTTTTKQN